MSAQIENRERESFNREIALVEAREKLAASAQASSDASAAKSLLMAAVNHDLRQPAASATLYLERLTAHIEECAPSCMPLLGKVRECVGAITDNLSRLSVVADLNDKERVLVPTQVDLCAILDRLVGVYSGPALERKIRFEVALPRRGNLTLMTDGARLGDVLANLVSNALKFTSEDGRGWVAVRAIRFGSRIRITVRDNGIGIAKHHHHRVFDEYFQIDNAERDRDRGYGLGLSIVRDTIARLPGHSIFLRSALGEGTRFDVWVPLAPTIERAVGESAWSGLHSSACNCEETLARGCGHELEEKERNLRGVYVLLVEDDPLVRSALIETLKGWGMLVDAAASPEAALALARRAERLFDLVVSDFGFDAALDGLDLIREVRGEQGRVTPAIIFSGQIPSIDEKRLSELQVRAVSKPIHAERLRAELDACLTSV
ncbi:hybrid sensor histidine kinase/response regulator [Zeimonas arvi]|uniref:hybrid sensor histidine kinase/response regulator n=1 Tax=Zeimonas arvi TaxID=2498847 RepID=UPI00165072CE|nr:hybrid sensor histidine kinase/response regulator [Zeimonas arvi]